MMTNYEAEKIKQEMERELEASTSTLVKCAVGLIAVVCIVALGTVPPPESNLAAHAPAATAQTANAE